MTIRITRPTALVAISAAIIALAAALSVVAGCGYPRSTEEVPSPAPPQASGGPTSQPSADEVTVAIDNFSYTPPTVTVRPGARVTWVNHDDVPHTVTAGDKSFTSAALETDEKFSRVFTQPGTYPYYCAVHPHMTGQVVVAK